jgi:hypothetical protein
MGWHGAAPNLGVRALRRGVRDRRRAVQPPWGQQRPRALGLGLRAARVRVRAYLLLLPGAAPNPILPIRNSSIRSERNRRVSAGCSGHSVCSSGVQRGEVREVCGTWGRR